MNKQNHGSVKRGGTKSPAANKSAIKESRPSAGSSAKEATKSRSSKDVDTDLDE